MTDSEQKIYVQRIPDQTIRKYEVWLDDKKIGLIPNKSDMFSFPLEKGDHTLQIRIFPIVSSDVLKFSLNAGESAWFEVGSSAKRTNKGTLINIGYTMALAKLFDIFFTKILHFNPFYVAPALILGCLLYIVWYISKNKSKLIYITCVKTSLSSSPT